MRQTHPASTTDEGSHVTLRRRRPRKPADGKFPALVITSTAAIYGPVCRNTCHTPVRDLSHYVSCTLYAHTKAGLVRGESTHRSAISTPRPARGVHPPPRPSGLCRHSSTIQGAPPRSLKHRRPNVARQSPSARFARAQLRETERETDSTMSNSPPHWPALPREHSAS